MNARKKIYCDLDGVLCDFFHGFSALVGLTPAEGKALIDPQGWIRSDLLAPPYRGLSGAALHMLLGQSDAAFWSELPVIPEGVELFKEVRDRGVAVAILTRPTPEPNAVCLEGKVDWVRRHLGDVEVIFTQDKAAYAHPGAVLIDDEPRNVEAFRAAGGSAFLWPQPWHIPRIDVAAAELCRRHLTESGVL
jgi:5'(3')-deoxyribonucleotidase